MIDPSTFDPFAGIADDEETSPADARAGLLEDALRGYAPLRKSLVQRPRGSDQLASRPGRRSVRASTLADMVTGRHERALDLLLLLHALQPVLTGSPLSLGTWANLMSVGRPCTSTGVTRAIDTLVDLELLTREGTGHAPVLTPLLEDGSGKPWVRAGSVEEQGPGYFVIPHEYWTQGWSERLKMPGKAMFLILSAETQSPKTPAFAMAVERAAEWYGISERTAERGYTELSAANLTTVKVQKVRDDRHPAGRREVYWRTLNHPFSTANRAHLQALSSTAARAADGVAGPDATPTAAAAEPSAKAGEEVMNG